MLYVIDAASSQWNLDFGIAWAEGFRACYIKMGGDNVDTYVAPWYTRQVPRARAAGFQIVGHYWVPDGNPDDPDLIDTPTQQADYMVDHLHDWRKTTDFVVLDNEALDGAWMLTDAGAAEFIERVKSRLDIPGRQVAMYGGWYDLAGRQWPLVLATGAVFIVADYRAASQPGMNFPDIPTIPRDRIIGHQTGGRAIGGVVTDTNTFVDDAFDYGGAVAYLEARPARGNINTPFGPRPKPTPTSPAIHYGQDYGWGGGDQIYAARGGVVRDYSYSGAYGNRMIVEHGEGRQTWYCHIRDGGNVVPVGAEVSAGQQIAWMGATGNVTAKHLHFELRINGVAVDPEPYFAGASTAGGSSTPVIEEDEDMKKPYIRIQSEGRGIALVTPGYYRHLLNTTEVEISAGFVDRHETVNDAQFDFLVSIFLHGTGSNSLLDSDVKARIDNLSVKAEIPADFAAAVAAGTAAAVESQLQDDFARVSAIDPAVVEAVFTEAISKLKIVAEIKPDDLSNIANFTATELSNRLANG